MPPVSCSTFTVSDSLRQSQSTTNTQLQLLGCETDQIFPRERQAFASKTITGLRLEYDYQHFPGLSHSFASRGDPNDARQKCGLEMAKNMVICWFSQQLHA